MTPFLILIGLHLLLICTQRLYPFTDLPNHLAAATISRYYDDPSNRFAEFYALDRFLKPNVFHQSFCGLPLFPSVEAANRAFLCLYVLLLPLSVLLVIKHMGGTDGLRSSRSFFCTITMRAGDSWDSSSPCLSSSSRCSYRPAS